MWKLAVFGFFLASFLIIPSKACTNPVISSNSFVTEDSTHLTNIAYIVVFDVKCGSEQFVQNLYAEINGNIAPVSVVDKNSFQISWTEDLKSSSSGEKVVRIYEEKDIPTLRRNLRSNEDSSSVPTLGTIVVNHPRVYTGPYLQWELVTVIASSIAAYYAVTSKLDISS
ncbi:hypothetical protein WA026_011824 [Henosepilachna vigintioctopunctata]|uniref:Translocon-associated protein subunit delta n=1 Tax=Henosepilachna vigintioctopunctata TaxID=420089 RepID=A0AAW1UIS9_9CUCU